MSFLSADTVRTIVANTPLIAIDRVLVDEHGCILLSERKNRPAQGYSVVGLMLNTLALCFNGAALIILNQT
tara:strand:- start:697 stop:909 length:213 start_codon:yes stop_codon:yes gene_type:complete